MMNRKSPTAPIHQLLYPVADEPRGMNHPPYRYQEDFDGFVMAYDKVKVHGKEVRNCG